LAFLLGTGAGTVHPAIRLMAASANPPEITGQSAPQALLKTASAKSPDIPFHEYEVQAEQDLLQLANQSRRQAGISPLKLDSGLSGAARAHAVAMMDAQKLSHQFAGEVALPQRLAVTTNLQLDQEGENVALDYDALHGHEHLMLSPPHRANLLNPAYNVIGLGVVRGGDRLYIVQDFGHALPAYSIDEVKHRVASAVDQLRRHSGLPALTLRDSPPVDDSACSMAQADKLGTSAIQRLAKQSTVLAYTSLRPETLPRDAPPAVTGRNLRTLSVGACYAPTETYPTGVYWIVLVLN